MRFTFHISLFTIIIALLLSSTGAFSQSKVIEDGEVLSYEVTYGFIHIGQVTFKTFASGGHFKSTAALKSNDALPFVNINYAFESEYTVEGTKLKLISSKAIDYASSNTLYYDFKYDSLIINMKKVNFNNEVEFSKTIPLSTDYQDGLTIFYFSRLNSFESNTLYVPVLMNFDSTTMTLNVNTATGKTDITAIDNPVSSVTVSGSSNFAKAVFGMSGEFEGWFSKDEARVPLKSKLKVSIGNVTLELVKWKRNGWR